MLSRSFRKMTKLTKVLKKCFRTCVLEDKKALTSKKESQDSRVMEKKENKRKEVETDDLFGGKMTDM